MRPISDEVYAIPSDRVIGSSTALAYTPDEHGGTIMRVAPADYLDDGPEKPVRIWSRTGRRPVLAAGNSNGDVPMLDFTQHDDKPFLRLLVSHDDGEREFEYTSGAEQALDRASAAGWTVVSMRDDWTHGLLAAGGASSVAGGTDPCGDQRRRPLGQRHCRRATAVASAQFRSSP